MICFEKNLETPTSFRRYSALRASKGVNTPLVSNQGIIQHDHVVHGKVTFVASAKEECDVTLKCCQNVRCNEMTPFCFLHLIG